MSDHPTGVTEVAKSIVEGLKPNPSCLAAITLAAIFGLLTYYSLVAERHEMHERSMRLIDHCFPAPREKVEAVDLLREFNQGRKI